MTGFTSKRQMAQDKTMTRPLESDYTSQVAYTRALEAYCDTLAQPNYRAVKTYHDGKPVYVSQPEQEPLTDKQILADETLRYYFGQNGGAGPVSKQGRRVVDAIEAIHGIKEKSA